MSDIFIPPGATNTKDITIGRRYICLMGLPGSGKTYTTLMTSPNPIAALFENAITDERIIKKNIPTLDFYKPEWTENVYKQKSPILAFNEFLKSDAKKLTINQTLLISSLSSYDDVLKEYLWSKVKTTTSGEKDVFAYYGDMLDWYTDLLSTIGKLSCHVVLEAHIDKNFNKDGAVIGILPMVEGKTRLKMGRHFTDIVMQVTKEKKVGEKVTTDYLWQVKSDSLFTAKCRKNIDTLYIPADFNELLKP
jgi:hypothetical protein